MAAPRDLDPDRCGTATQRRPKLDDPHDSVTVGRTRAALLHQSTVPRSRENNVRGKCPENRATFMPFGVAFLAARISGSGEGATPQPRGSGAAFAIRAARGRRRARDRK